MPVSTEGTSTMNHEISRSKSVNVFGKKYLQYCKCFHTKPLKLLKLQATNAALDFIGDRIKYDDWIPLLKAISTDRNLHFIALRSRHSPGTVILEHVNTEKLAREVTNRSVLFTKFMIPKVIEAFAQCVANNKALTCLQFQSIPIKSEAMKILAEAISTTNYLQHLSFQSCNIGDEACKLISQALKNRSSVISLDVSDCNISEEGAMYISDLIKTQEIARFGECWKHSLRYREVSHEVIPGLRRINLSNNPNIGDEGLEYLITVLKDDYWIKAIDMQNCGITDMGCISVVNLINMNNEIVIFDIRRNPIQDPKKMAEIIHLLCSHTKPNDWEEYGWLKLDNSSTSSSSCPSTISSNSIYRSPHSKLNKQVKEVNSLCERNVRSFASADVLKKTSAQRLSSKTVGPVTSASLSSFRFKQANPTHKVNIPKKTDVVSSSNKSCNNGYMKLSNPVKNSSQPCLSSNLKSEICETYEEIGCNKLRESWTQSSKKDLNYVRKINSCDSGQQFTKYLETEKLKC